MFWGEIITIFSGACTYTLGTVKISPYNYSLKKNTVERVVETKLCDSVEL